MPEIEVPCPTCAGTIVPDHASVVAALSRRAAEILARHGYPEKPLTGDIDLGMLPIADMAALASSPTPDGVIKDRGEDGRRPDGPGLSHSVARPKGSPAAAASIPGADDALNARLKAAGMYTIPEMMGVTPLSRWMVQVGMDNLDFFQAWLERRIREFLRMKAGYELGDNDKGDELYEWVLAHSAALSEVRDNFLAARASPPDTPSSQDSGVGESEGWQPIETAPRDGTVIQICGSASGPYAAYFGMAQQACNPGDCDKNYPWVILDETNGTNCMSEGAPYGARFWHPLSAAPRPSQREG